MKILLYYFITIFIQLQIISSAFNNTSNQTIHDEENKFKGVRNYFPVIGILTLPSGFQKYNYTMYSYIYTSYIQYFQQSGARIIPLKYTENMESLLYKIKRINGLVIPGGGTNLMQRNTDSGDKEFTKFAEVGKYLINEIKRINKQGVYLPIWGTCLGFELLVLSFIKQDIRSQFQGENHLGDISLSPSNAYKSRLFINISQQIKESINQKRQIFYFNHKHGFKTQKFLKKGILKNHFLPLAYSQDLNGKKFVSIIEAKLFPFYGVQFHPEKLQFEWNQSYSKNLTINDINIVQYFANFFFQECLKSKQRFNNYKKLTQYLIENNRIIYIKGFEQGEDEFKLIVDHSNQQNTFIEDREDNSYNQLEEKNHEPQLNQNISNKNIDNLKTEKDKYKISLNIQENEKQLNSSNNDEILNQLNKQNDFLLKCLIFLISNLLFLILIYIIFGIYIEKQQPKISYNSKQDEELQMIKVQYKND